MALYAATSCRTVHGGDSAEFSLVFATMGVAHPPGYPLFTLVSALVVRLLFFVDPAWASNLLSGLWAACAVGLAFAWLRRLGLAASACAFAAIALAVSRTFWSQAVVAEVYTFDLLGLLVVLHAGRSAATSSRRLGWLWLGLAAGLWLGHRHLNAIFLPGVAVMLWAQGLRVRSVRPIAPLLAGLALSVVPFAYLPLASRFNPPLDYGNTESWDGFVHHISGAGFSHLLTSSPERIAFRLEVFLSSLPAELGLALPLGVAGAVVLYRRGPMARKLLVGLGLVMVANLGFAASYDVPDMEVYFLVAYLLIALLAAFGADALLAWLRERLSPSSRRATPRALVAVGAVALPFSWRANDLGRVAAFRLMAEDILSSAAPKALLLVHGDSVANSLYYLQQVEERAPDVAVVYCTLSQRWYFEHLRELYPQVPWPSHREGEAWEMRTARLVETLGRHRSVYFTTELDPSVVLRRGPLGKRWVERYRIVQVGLVKQERPRDEPVDDRAEGARSLELLQSSAAKLRGTSLRVDVDTKITYLQYAFALLGTGRQLEGRDDALSLRAYRAALALEPDAFERSYRAEQAWRTGRPVPRLDIEAHLRTAIERLERRAAMPAARPAAPRTEASRQPPAAPAGSVLP